MKIRAFTDGACSGNPGPGGWAAILCLEEGSEEYSGYATNTTNNRMEVAAVAKCLQAILKRDDGNEYEIHSDSSYVVGAINMGWIQRWQKNGWKTRNGSSVMNKDLWERLIGYMDVLKDRKCKVKFVKVKGHAGNTFNELADQLAKRGCEVAKEKLKG